MNAGTIYIIIMTTLAVYVSVGYIVGGTEKWKNRVAPTWFSVVLALLMIGAIIAGYFDNLSRAHP